MSNNQNDSYRFSIDAEYVGHRLDKALSVLCEELSRARVQALLQDGFVQVNGDVCLSASYRLSEGDEVVLEVPPPVPCDPLPEDIPLDIVYEDEHLLVLNKPAGLVVHPGAGNYSGTLVNALLHHCGDSLSGIGGVLRPGIVHRLDKDTSGLMVVAKSDTAHQGLAAQLEDRSLSRVYHALVLGVPMPPKGVVDQPIGRHPGNRLLMAVSAKGGKEARTHYKVLETYRDVFSLVECRLESGRTHQIRVHMAHLKHPLIGDPAYGPQPTAVQAALKRAAYGADVVDQVMAFPRQVLQARALSFVHPVTEEEVSFEAPFSGDLTGLLALL